MCWCLILVWMWVLSITLQGNLSPWRALCVVKEQKKLCHCQAFTWTALQSTPLRAAILERLAWAEIAAWRPGIHSQHQPRHPLEKSWGGANLMAELEMSFNVTVSSGLQISWGLGMFPDIYNQFVTAKLTLYSKFSVQLSCCHVAKGDNKIGRGNGEEE